MTTVAAVDCGTNSTRLLIVRDGVPLARPMTITRLGQGVDATGRLAPEALERTFAVLGEYRSLMDDHGVERLRAAATSAARDASNSEDFFEGAEAILGCRPELLSGEEEGRLSFAGATSGLDPALGPFLVADIGGGSTEMIVGTTEPVGVRSLDVGCVRVTERFLEHDPPMPEELSNALEVVGQHVDDVVREVPEVGSAQTFIGLAGTITTVAAVELGLHTHDPAKTHHFVLTRAAVEDVFRTLATESLADRVHNPGLPEARADVIVGGVLVLVKIMRVLGLDECLVSEADILDGLAASIA